MPHSDASLSSEGAGAQTATARPSGREISAGELSRATIEVLAGAGPDGIGLDELARGVAAALQEPLPASFQEQLDVLLTNEYVERYAARKSYRLTTQGEWLLQGIEVVHG